MPNRKDRRVIALAGDSVLDDFYWLDEPERDVRAQLQEIMPQHPDTRVYNFAVDESRIIDVLQGTTPRQHYVVGRQKVFGDTYKYPAAKDGKVYPLSLVETVKASHVVLSIGGNDGRVHLDKIIHGADALINTLLEEGFLENFRNLLDRILKLRCHPTLILVFVYKPHKSIFPWYKEQMLGSYWSWLPIDGLLNLRSKLDQAYSKIRAMMLELAAEYQIPVIDLSRTFNPEKAEHYGSTPIEPSNLSGMAIARLIKHVIQDQESRADNGRNSRKSRRTSRIYWAPDCGLKIEAESNTKTKLDC